MDIQEKIELLARRISELSQQQSIISGQLLELTEELKELKRQATRQTHEPIEPKPVKTIEVTEPVVAPSRQPETPQATAPRAAKTSSSFEEFIGKNLASKVGILVTIVGIFIGARYAIEHNLVSPVVRIIAGYFSGLALVILGVFLKKKYEAYSSVLMGGGLAVLYFITYTAYGYYALMPQLVAFILMLLFTVIAVYASLVYNRVIIAHLGLVAAYGIPFLLSDNSGKYAVLFSYITIINAGILVISFRKYWKSLFYAAFAITWCIYGVWHLLDYNDTHFGLGFIFRSIFFMLFYMTFLAYKLVKKEKYRLDAIIVILSNAFLFYLFGYDAVSSATNANTGLFTVVNAAIHFGISQLIRPRVVDKALYYLILGLSIVFITIAVPVQFDGNWVTLLWMAEAALLFIIGRIRKAGGYEKLSAAVLLLGVFSLVEDWLDHIFDFRSQIDPAVPFANIIFVTGIISALAMGSMLYFLRNKKYPSAIPAGTLLGSYLPHFITILFLVTTYFVFFVEIDGYFIQVGNHLRGADGSFVLWHSETDAFRYVTELLYSMVFVAIAVWVDQRWIKKEEIKIGSMVIIGLLAFVFLSTGLPALNELSANYFDKQGNGLYFGLWNVTMRYIMAAVMMLLLLQGREAAFSYGENSITGRGWQLVIHVVVLGLLSAEYLQWTGISGQGNQYKLGLSILWGAYALFLVVWGIYKKLKHLRMAGIALFIISLVKLFIYDLAESDTVTKTISFISLGVMLLLVSYLYNRYKDLLFGRDE